jgi:hypothetical protein
MPYQSIIKVFTKASAIAFDWGLRTSYPYGETPNQRPTVSVEAALMPNWAGGFGLFARHVSGQDYYNILFLERVNLWLFGIVFELGPGVNIPLGGEKGLLPT